MSLYREDLVDKPLLMFQDTNVAEAFMAVDPNILRSAVRSISIPPPGLAAPPGLVEQQHEGPQNRHVCELELAPGQQCGQVFQTKTRLATHQSTAKLPGHGPGLASKMVCNNQCPFCKNIWTRRDHVVTHVRKSLEKLQCPSTTRGSSFLHKPSEPATLECKICAYRGSSLADLHLHFREHTPQGFIFPS